MLMKRGVIYLVILRIGFGKLKIFFCYDLRFFLYWIIMLIL